MASTRLQFNNVLTVDHGAVAYAERVADTGQGSPSSKVPELVEYWRSGHDWRRVEGVPNGYAPFVTEIDGVDIHVLNDRSPHADAVPMIMTHGWPGSIPGDPPGLGQRVMACRHT